MNTELRKNFRLTAGDVFTWFTMGYNASQVYHLVRDADFLADLVMKPAGEPRHTDEQVEKVHEFFEFVREHFPGAVRITLNDGKSLPGFGCVETHRVTVTLWITLETGRFGYNKMWTDMMKAWREKS